MPDKKYQIPAEAKHSMTPPIFSFCDHCNSYQWADWYGLDLPKYQIELLVCQHCNQMSERSWYYLNMALGN